MISGARLTVDNVFSVLKKTGRDWRSISKWILLISSTKCDDLERRYATDDERLKEAIDFWLKRCVFASWRSLLNQFDRFKLDAAKSEAADNTEPILGECIRV